MVGTRSEPTPPVFLTGCGILGKEVRHLIGKNGWETRARFLPSSLHVDFDRLEHALVGALGRSPPGETAVFYGACHPRMTLLLEKAGSARTPGQNCIDILLGREAFDRHLAAGAFFLLEDWALHWDEMTHLAFGNTEVRREVFRGAHRYVLGVRTPCSGDFTARAEAICADLGLPLQWIRVSLDHLEAALATVLRPRGTPT